MDLRDAGALATAVRDAGPVSHVVYAALFEKDDLIAGWVDREQIDTNRLMFANVLDALRAARAPVRHVSILQGTKAYGYHLGRMRIPGKESQPRVDHGNFYWAQEDLLVSAARSMDATYTIFRPQFVFSGVLGAAMNLIPAIGVYAALCRELGRPFSFPGGESYVAEAVDARLLADALHWAATALGAGDETFNITNGDVFEWRDLWGSFAAGARRRAGPGPAPMPVALVAGSPGHLAAHRPAPWATRPFVERDPWVVSPVRGRRLRVHERWLAAGEPVPPGPAEHDQAAPGGLRQLHRHRADVCVLV